MGSLLAKLQDAESRSMEFLIVSVIVDGLFQGCIVCAGCRRPVSDDCRFYVPVYIVQERAHFVLQEIHSFWFLYSSDHGRLSQLFCSLISVAFCHVVSDIYRSSSRSYHR